MSSQRPSLVMLGAMYENGGNTTHRHLDGHPELFVYPFESQIGTRLVHDQYTSMFPNKYRWPVFDLAASPADDFRAIIDEETKVRARTPHVSKFRDWPFDLDDDLRRHRFVELTERHGRSRPGNVLSFFESTFDCWRDLRRTGSERYVVGYSPVLVVDAEVILSELDDAHFVHVVRNPWSAYADTTRRPVPLALRTYIGQWVVNQHLASAALARFPDRMHVVRLEDVVADPASALEPLCTSLGIDPADAALRGPSWNGSSMEQVYPWGTIRTPTPDANRATAELLTDDDRAEISRLAEPWIERLGYSDFLG
ncbi:MAG: sulfotransferase [Actinobacteria bacterium]|nr:sulfotransferase [Actinomycetota bacterium]